MGLAAPKRRSRISHDPNNTRWTRDDTSFGRRILQKQGWTPGSYLGATDAAHAAHYTAANASHVRVILKEDNLGLGASKNQNAERFGLDMFSGLLGRLNGKVEGSTQAIDQRHETAKRDVHLRLWQEGRYGGVRFVSAGFLVGDEVKELRREQLEAVQRKRKAATAEQAQDADVTTKGNKRRKVAVAGSTVADIRPSASAQQEDDAKLETDSRSSKSEDANIVLRKGTASSEDKSLTAKEVRKAERAEKRHRKEARRQRKLEKQERRARRLAEAPSPPQVEVEVGPSGGSSSSTPAVEVTVVEARPTVSGRRGAVRQRWVQQKKLATMDSKALNEIFMIKMTA